VVVDALAPVRERTEKLLANEAELDSLLAAGAGRAAALARQTMTAVMDQVGFLPPR
jgi:tryptophanyl-tRNA synthetase